MKNTSSLSACVLAWVACIANSPAKAGDCEEGVTAWRVSVATGGEQGNGQSAYPTMSADIRFVAFQSSASGLVPDDSNGVTDIFVRDRDAGTTQRVSVSSLGQQANGGSRSPSISADGRLVVFDSDASNLVSNDTNGFSDVFLHDRATGVTRRISLSSDGAQAQGGGSRYGQISADGRFVAFQSTASNLVPDDTNGRNDAFVHELLTGITERVSVSSGGAEGGSGSLGSLWCEISEDGRLVAFTSDEQNLVPNDTNQSLDVFVHDRVTHETERVSVASDGAEGNDESKYATISADGRYVAFASGASNLVAGDMNSERDAFVHDRVTGETVRVNISSEGAESVHNYFGSVSPSISASGRFVAFWSESDNLTPDDTNGQNDIFVHDRLTATTRRVSVAFDGGEAQASSFGSYIPRVSADGDYVAFTSVAHNLVPGDTNEVDDAFVAYIGEIFADLPGDATFDGVVNMADLNAVLGMFANSGAFLPADLNQDGVINFHDLNEVLSNFGSSCD